jgi:hypothetical protein
LTVHLSGRQLPAMGYGGYSYEAHQAITSARANQTASQVFAKGDVHAKMNPKGVRARECRDSAEHPDAVGIVFALDISGSMGDIPDLLARRELPRFMKVLLDCGIAHPQILFMAFADARYDATPLQVGQFESTAELMDQWLTMTSLFNGQRGNAYAGPLQGGESYELALYFAARHTLVDGWEKRQRKGYLFMTGDEEAYPAVPRETVTKVLGYDPQVDVPLPAVMTELRAKWNPFFIIPDQGRRAVEPFWREHFGDNTICLEGAVDTCTASALLVALSEGVVRDLAHAADVLRASGAAEDRTQATIRALTPWYAAHTKR